MNKLALLACLSLLLTTACGQEPQNENAQAAPPAPSAEAPATSPEATAPAPQSTPAAPGSESGDTIAAGEEVETQDDDTPAETRANTQLAAALAPAEPSGSDPAARWVEGQNYRVFVPARPANVAPDRVEVVEMFWYGCGHCYALDPHLEEWSKNGKPPYVEFTRVPVTWGPVQRAHAKLFYILEALGKGDELHEEVFKAIHEGGQRLWGPTEAETMREQIAFATRHGISEAEFRKAAGSMSVETRLRRAEALTRAYEADSVPRMIVNGRYSADVSSAGGQTQLIALVNDLAAREQKRR